MSSRRVPSQGGIFRGKFDFLKRQEYTQIMLAEALARCSLVHCLKLVAGKNGNHNKIMRCPEGVMPFPQSEIEEARARWEMLLLVRNTILAAKLTSSSCKK